MDKRIQLFLECQGYCIPITSIRETFMEIQDLTRCVGFSQEEAKAQANQFYEQVAMKLN